MTFLLNSTLQLRPTVAEWLVFWVRRSRAWVQIAAATLSGNTLRQTVHTHRTSLHQAAKLLAALLSIADVTAALEESNGSLSPGSRLTSPAGWLPRNGISSGTLRSAIECKLSLPFYTAALSAAKFSTPTLWKTVKFSFTEPSWVSPVQQQASYDSVFHQLQQAQHHCWQSTWHWTHHPNTTQQKHYITW